MWQAAADVSGAGWTAEMRIPFAQLRFSSPPGRDIAKYQLHLVTINGSNCDFDDEFRSGEGDARIDADIGGAGQGPVERLTDRAARLRREQVEGGRAEEPVWRVKGTETQRRGVGELDAVLTADEDSVG